MGILRGIGARQLACGCVAGLYETYDGRTIAILDVPEAACGNPQHRPDVEVDLAASSAELVGEPKRSRPRPTNTL